MYSRRFGVLLCAALTTCALSPSVAAAAKPKNTSLPQVTGEPAQGKQLTATKGQWGPAGTTYAYQWQRCADDGTCTAIKGQTKTTYTVATADVGNAVRAVVKATNTDGTTSAKSPMTDSVDGDTGGDPPPTGDITVSLPVRADAQTINTQLSTQDVWNGNLSGLPKADGQSAQDRLNALAPPNMRFHVGTDGGWSDNNTMVGLPFPAPPLGSALPYKDTGSGMTISKAWDFSHMNSLLSEAKDFDGPDSANPLLLNLRYLPDNMYTGTHTFGSPGVLSDMSYDAAAEYFADVLAYYNTSGPQPPVAGMTPWPKPGGPWPIRYVEIHNEPDYSSENPRVPPTLTAPTLTAAKVQGGTLAAGTYNYRASGLNSTGSPGNGETAAGPVAAITLTADDIAAGRRSVKLTWAPTTSVGLSPSAYVIYGRTASSRKLMTVVGDQAPGGLTFTDTGAITPGGPSAPANDSDTGGGGPVFSPLEYKTFWDKVAPALKAVDPNVKLVGPATTNPEPINAPSVIRTAGPTSGPNDDSYHDRRSYYELLEEPSEPNKPDVMSYHGYGGWNGTETNAQMLKQIDTIAAGIRTNILPYSGNTPLWQTEANVNATGMPAGDARATNQFAAAWWGKMFAVMSQTSPNIQRVFHYVITESNTYDLIWDSTYKGIAGSLAGRPTMPYWAIMNLDQAFPAGSKLLDVSGAPAGSYVVAAALPPTFTHVNVLVANAPSAEAPLSGTLKISGRAVTASTRRTIDASTSMATGPAAVDGGALNDQPINLGGYGLTIYGFDT